MKSYLMRHAGDPESGPAGLVVAGSLDELWDTVDEWDNPNAYEYAVLKGCGGFFAGFSNSKMTAENWIAQLPSEEFPPAPGEKNVQWKKFADLLKQPFDEWYAGRYAVPKSSP